MDEKINVLVNYFAANDSIGGKRIIKNNTDFLYPQNFKLLQDSNLHISFNNSKRSFLYTLSLFSLKRAAEKARVNLEKSTVFNRYMKKVYVPESLIENKSLFFSHGFFPFGLRSKGIPVLTNTGFMTNAYEKVKSDEERWKEVNQICELSTQATFITLGSNNAIDRLCSFVPKMRDKIKLAPYLLPAISPITEEEMYRKHFGSKLKICFVGIDGKRKGLLNLLDAIKSIYQADPQLFFKCEFTFVTTTSFTLPRGIEYTHYHSLPNPEVFRLMRESAIFCMPTLHDAYGLVYLEAMGNGCAVLCDDEMPRKEIFNHKMAHFTNPASQIQIEKGLRKLITDHQYRFNLATWSYAHFNQNYSFEITSKYYKDLFQETIQVEKSRMGVGSFTFKPALIREAVQF